MVPGTNSTVCRPRATLEVQASAASSFAVGTDSAGPGRSTGANSGVAAAAGPGATATIAVLGRYVKAIATNTGVLRLQREESDAFVRLCTTSASAFQTRMVSKVAEVLADDRAGGHLSIDLDDDELAFAVVRLLEAYAHAPTLTGQPADPELAARVLRALLR